PPVPTFAPGAPPPPPPSPPPPLRPEIFNLASEVSRPHLLVFLTLFGGCTVPCFIRTAFISSLWALFTRRLTLVVARAGIGAALKQESLLFGAGAEDEGGIAGFVARVDFGSRSQQQTQDFNAVHAFRWVVMVNL